MAEATRGVRLPTEPVVVTFVTACGADPQPWSYDSEPPPRPRCHHPLRPTPIPAPLITPRRR
ncbi:hypothetical protein [Fodinicola feengrottensis]|uniref:hypothetical protein n=1 Tax=Fodinicola feengrottensis TaxID=435914 RepID=UPI0031D1D91B